jgi:DnaJ-class molecular chaperone
MGLSDRHIAEKDRCSTCQGSGWTWWPAKQPPEEGKWIVCRACIGTGRTDHNGRKRQKPDEAPGS